MDDSNTPAYTRLCAATWIGIRMEILSTSITLTLSLLGVTSSSDGATIGLALTYAGGITGLLNLLLISTSQLETELNSVERLSVYCNDISQEKPARFDSDPIAIQWPSRGDIMFSNISLSYPSRPDLNILKNLSLHIKPGEKVGVIGRTGSGKSTLVTALFRIVELQSGSILIDNEGFLNLISDISKMGLYTLRSRLQIIPQEPVLFSGTIRSNLDIECSFEDNDIWHVLNLIGMKKYVS